VKILDFGIALDESARRLTWFGLSNTVGTPDYMAPEQVGGRRGDDRTDIYAVGTMLYEMLTGELPYTGANVHSVMRAKQNEDPRPPSQIVPSIDTQVEEIVLHAIERAPRYRYSSAKEMLQDLKDPSQVKPRPEEQRSRAHGPLFFIPRKFVMTAIVVGIIVALVALVWLSSRGSRGPKRSRPTYSSETK